MLKLEVGKTYVDGAGTQWRCLATDRNGGPYTRCVMLAKSGAIQYSNIHGVYCGNPTSADMVREWVEPREWDMWVHPTGHPFINSEHHNEQNNRAMGWTLIKVREIFE